MEKFESLKDAKSGYVVELANGELCMCMRYEQEKFTKVLITKDGKEYIFYSKGLRHSYCKKYDIVKIYGLCEYSFGVLSISIKSRPLLWERKEPKKMTVEEIIKELGYEVEIIKG